MKIGKRLLHILTCVICMTLMCGNSLFSYVKAEGEMTWAQLQELVNEGGEITLTNDVIAGAGIRY